MQQPVKLDRQRAVSATVSHAARHSPYYRDQDWAARLRAGQEVAFRDIPITPAAVVKAETTRFYSDFIPPEDGPVFTKYTSGSTGEPLEVRKTDLSFQVNAMENLRLRKGWGVDDHRHLLHVVSPNPERPIGRVVVNDLKNGRRKWELASLDTSAVFDLLSRTSATHVVGYPSIVLGTLERSAELSRPLALRLISTVGEVVSDELRQRVRQIPNCRLVDLYGAIESGVILSQCAFCDAYHPANRHLFVELLDEDGRPIAPGEEGRVVVTPLFNRAMPLLRYEIGDYAVLAEPNGCRRSPHAVARIVGREKNLFKLPDGRRIAPMVPSKLARELGMRQFKLIQPTLGEIDLLYVPCDGVAELQPQAAQNVIDRYLSPGFKVRPVRVAAIPRAPGGKFLMHESLV